MNYGNYFPNLNSYVNAYETVDWILIVLVNDMACTVFLVVVNAKIAFLIFK